MLIAALVTLPGKGTMACVYDGLLGPGITAAHPRSIAVAISVREAVETGVLPGEAIAFVPGNAGFWQAMRRLRAFQRLVSSSAVTLEGPVWILLVDSNLWARLQPTADGLELEVHTPPAPESATVLVTAEAVLAAMAAGTIAVRDALALGMIEIDGELGTARTLSTSLAAAVLNPDRAQTLGQSLFGSRFRAVSDP